MKHLALLFGMVSLTAMKLPDKFSCSGTEPFWGFKQTPKGLVFDLMGADKPEEFPLKGWEVTGFHGMAEAAGFVVRGKRKDGKPVTLTYIPAPGCSDGMSERKYQGYGVFDNGKYAYYGCCIPTGKAP